MSNLTETEMVIVLILIAVILVLIAIIGILDYASKKKKKEEIEEEQSLKQSVIEEEVEQIEQPSLEVPTMAVEETPVVAKEKQNRIEEIRYVEEDEELEKTKAKIELAELKEELRRQEEEKKLELEREKVIEVEEKIVEVQEVSQPVINPEVTPTIVETPQQNEVEVENKIEPEIEKVQTPEEVIEPINEQQIEVLEIASAINEQLVKEEVEQKEANLQKVAEVQEDLIELLEIGIEEKIAEHEDEQERKAIISVEEFNKISDEMYENNEIVQNAYGDEGDEPISLVELENLYNAKETKTVKLADFNTPIEESKESIIKEADIKKMEDLPPIAADKKFKSTPVISPVYGISETKETIELEQTANLDKLNDEIKKTNEFLKTLKELQKNLD